jgi:deoxyribodipyrimidine photo-lyase
VYFNRDYTPYARQRDTRATRGLQMTGVVTQVFDDVLLVSPHAMLDEVVAADLGFAAFHERWLAALDLDPVPLSDPIGGSFAAAVELPESLDEWRAQLQQAPAALPEPTRPSDSGVTPAAARDRLRSFVADELAGYRARDEDVAGWLAIALDLGTLSVREVARAALRRGAADQRSRPGAEGFLEVLARREYAAHWRFAHPDRPGQPPD